MTPSVDAWLGTARTPDEPAAKARTLIERDAAEDLSGARAFYQDGQLFYTQRMAAVVSRRLGAST